MALWYALLGRSAVSCLSCIWRSRMILTRGILALETKAEALSRCQQRALIGDNVK